MLLRYGRLHRLSEVGEEGPTACQAARAKYIMPWVRQLTPEEGYFRITRRGLPPLPWEVRRALGNKDRAARRATRLGAPSGMSL